MTDPRWVLLGGCCLAFLASALNTSFMLQLGTSVSHLTGDLARFAGDLASAPYEPDSTLVHLFAALGGFVLGATLGGVFIHHPLLEMSRPYGRSISSIGLTLLAAWWALGRADSLALLLAGTACGFQNALATHYRGIVLRTTHVTGLLTDFGVGLGMTLRGHSVARWKVLVPGALVLAFFVGAVAGALLTWARGRQAVLYVALAYLLGGLSWTILKHFVLPRPAATSASHAAPRSSQGGRSDQSTA